MGIWGYHLITPFSVDLLLMATRNPVNSPVEVGSLSHYLQGFCFLGGAGCLPSTVFFHHHAPPPPPTASEGDRDRSLGRSRRVLGGSFPGDTFQVVLRGCQFSWRHLPETNMFIHFRT